VQCAQDSDCPSNTPFCNTDQNTCVQCRNSRDCPASTPTCRNGACH
jgi:hypothetical protein